MSDIRRIVRRKLRKHDPPEENFLNIYPMMDMMVILLVFLIMQFAVTSADIVQTDQLQIPYSTSQAEAQESTSITIATNAIVFENKNLVPLKDGLVDASQKQGGGNGFLISVLFRALENRREELKLIAQHREDRQFRGDVRIIADRRTPFRTLSEIVYTCGQSQFNDIRFVVIKEGGE